MIQHAGNAANQIQFEEHDGANNAKRVVIAQSGAGLASLPTVYAVVNTGAGDSVIDSTNSTTTTLGSGGVFTGVGLQVLDYISAEITIFADVASATDGLSLQTSPDNTNWDHRHTFTVPAMSAGLGKCFQVTLTERYFRVVYTNGGSAQADFRLQTRLNKVPSTDHFHPLDYDLGLSHPAATTRAVITGETTAGGGALVNVKVNPSGTLETNAKISTVTLAAGVNYIGLTTTTLGVGTRFIGLVTTVAGGNVTLNNAGAYIGLTTTTLGVGDRFIGLVTNVQAGLTTLAPSPNFIGLATVVIGNASVATKNAGTTKILKILPLTLSTNSNSSIAITNTFFITHLLLNANATVRLNIKSGATYLTGNASLGINIFPGGGWVENGSPDSPIYIGQAATAPIVVEKFDAGGIISQVAGKVVYFDE